MATSGNFSAQAWAWKDPYVAALMEADDSTINLRISEAEHVILARAKELAIASGDHIQEEEAMEDALYALRALKTCLALHGGYAEAA